MTMDTSDNKARSTGANSKHDDYDIVVIGAGIHGVSIACEANSRGLRTLLIHEGDIGGSASCTPMALEGASVEAADQWHVPQMLANGQELRYLHEKAAHLVRPLPTYFVDPSHPTLRRFILSVYSKLQGKLAETVKRTDLEHTFESTIDEKPVTEFSINYLRLVIGLIQRLTKGHSNVLAHHKLIDASRAPRHWALRVVDRKNDQEKSISARFLINCAGAKSVNVLKDALNLSCRGSATGREVSTLFVALENNWNHAAILPQEDNSFLRIQPFDKHHLCFGPIYHNNDENDAIKQALATWNQHAKQNISQDAIVFQRHVCLPQLEDPSRPSSGFVQEAFLDLNNPGNAAPLVTLFGINPIQFRKVAEQALDILVPFTHAQKDNTYSKQAILGGDFSDISVGAYTDHMQQRFSFLMPQTVERLVFTYGKNTENLLNHANSAKDLGAQFGNELYEAEVDYLKSHEWAKSAEDILWRRTFLGVGTKELDAKRLQDYMQS